MVMPTSHSTGIRIVDLHPHLDALVDDAEGRRLLDFDIAVDLVFAADDQGMDGSELGGLFGFVRHVVDLAVGDHDRAGDTLARRIRKGGLQRDVHVRAVSAGIGFRDPQLKRLVSVDLRFQRFIGGLRRLGAAAEIHAFRTVHDDGDDVLQRLALLLDPQRVGEGE